MFTQVELEGRPSRAALGSEPHLDALPRRQSLPIVSRPGSEPRPVAFLGAVPAFVCRAEDSLPGSRGNGSLYRTISSSLPGKWLRTPRGSTILSRVVGHILTHSSSLPEHFFVTHHPFPFYKYLENIYM